MINQRKRIKQTTNTNNKDEVLQIKRTKKKKKIHFFFAQGFSTFLLVLSKIITIKYVCLNFEF